MKFKDLKIGMKIKAIDNFYNMTNKYHKWTGFVYEIYDNGTFSARTESGTLSDKGSLYGNLSPQHFEKVDIQKKEVVTMNEIPLKVTYAHNTVYVIYKDKIVAKATCNQEDHFNEEFGLNLALRRFCKTLCDENTTKKVIYNTDKVEDFI